MNIERSLPTWDLVVLGGGTAGLVAAKTAGRFGARVLMVERDRTGGDCLWTGCVPSKALIAAAESVASARRAERFGVTVGQIDVDFAAVMRHVRAAIATVQPADSIESIEATGAKVVTGSVVLTGPDTVEVTTEGGTQQHRFRQAVVATGASPSVPPIPGLDQLDILTSDSVWDLTELPGELVVLGGGSIGSELGQSFARLGSSVTMIEGESRLLPREDPAASRAVTEAMKEDGVQVVTGSTVVSAEPDATDGSTGGSLTLEDGRKVRFDRLLVALGRKPRTDQIGLDAAGVDIDERGMVVVDEHLRTTNERIWAAGDLTGHPQFTHMAGVHGSLAASNAILGVKRAVNTSAVPRVTFTQPEVAAVGVSTFELADGIRVTEIDHADLDRAIAEAEPSGVSRLALDKKGRIVGATVVGPRAGETLGELAVAVSQGLKTRDLAGVIHPYPTYNDGPWNAAIADVRGQLEAPLARTAMRALALGRRWWLDRADR